MKKLSFLAVALLGMLGVLKAEIVISNPSGLQRTNETVEIKWSDVVSQTKLKAGQQVVVLDAAGKEIPSQVVFEGKKTPQKLIFQVTLAPKKSASFKLQIGTPQKYTAKAYGRFVPERKDDYAWENDRSAYRVYGPALQPIDGPSNGIDVWSKRTEELVINERYAGETAKPGYYHEDHGNGLDFYKVGRTLGAGAMAPYSNNTMWLANNFVRQENMDNGPIRTSVRLDYGKFIVNGDTITETRIISLDAGSQLNKISEIYWKTKGPMPVVAGIVKRDGADSIAFNAQKGYAAYCEPNTKDGTTYLALVLPRAWKSVKAEKGHILAETDYIPNKKLVYYSGAGWSKWGFPTRKAWVKYVQDYAAKLREPLMIIVK
ncbi:DUF4861 domain-containing protein [Parabacteroides sp. FAFU027]|uniref:DUF4861 domain-containing protein n=1 Tax=Parabacteroides sp. FAFU027 TaxID=2922715 RepID=UPI001FB02E54|nr:DUF4861 domain-containing protein [Parabacteroides sp. FAFU027]